MSGCLLVLASNYFSHPLHKLCRKNKVYNINTAPVTMLTTVSVSFETLKQKARQVNNERVGATNNIERRRGEYDRKGYSGTMYYFKTENMHSAENKL